MEIRTLRADEIEVKVKQVGEKGAVALLYKTARTDMAVLDEAFGQNNWTNDYKEIKGNLYCGIGIRMADTGEYVWRWDCGIESRADDEGNEKKGEASDAFKRAGTRWGIGRELYTSPFIFLSVSTVAAGKDTKGRPRYALADKFASFSVKKIGYDENRRISELVIEDEKGNIVYAFPKVKQAAKPPAGGAKGTVPNEETKKARKPAQSVKDALIEAKETQIVLKGTQYKLGALPKVTLEYLAEKSKSEEIREAAGLVLREKLKEEIFETDEPLPWEVKDDQGSDT